MENIELENSKGDKLVGMIHRSKEESGSLVIMSHGFAANKDRERFIKLGEAFNEIGVDFFRFDFGGSGESEDREITVESQTDDLRSIIKFMREKGYSNIGLMGESLGGLVSILSYDEDIRTLVLIGPVTQSSIPNLLQEKESQKEMNEKGFIIFEREGKEFKVPKKYVEERKEVNQEEILSKIKSPVLIIHGEKDETIPPENSRSAMKFLSDDSRLEVVKDGDHIMDDKMDTVVSLSVDWFKRYL